MSHDGKTSIISKGWWFFCGLWTPFLGRKTTFQLQDRERKMQCFFLSTHERTLYSTSQTHSLNPWELLGVCSSVRCLVGWDGREKNMECTCLMIWLSDVHIHIDIHTTFKQVHRPIVSCSFKFKQYLHIFVFTFLMWTEAKSIVFTQWWSFHTLLKPSLPPCKAGITISLQSRKLRLWIVKPCAQVHTTLGHRAGKCLASKPVVIVLSQPLCKIALFISLKKETHNILIFHLEVVT